MGHTSAVRALRRVSLEDVRLSLWFPPAITAVAALAAALLLVQVPLSRLSWPADVETASSVLQVIATSIITVTSLTFSLVVVALQLASQQFSPRLLREFARDWVIQSVLSVLVATFVFSLTVLLALRSQAALPKLAVLLAYLLGLLSVLALLAFLGHLVKALRIDTLMVAVHGETVATLEQSYRGRDEPEPPRPDGLPGPEGTLVPCPRSGFVKVIRVQRLLRVAEAADVLLWMSIRPGDHVVAGTPIASALRPDGSPVGDEQAERLAADVLEAVELGYERSSDQDAALGLRQLTDIAVKALSPGINDPVTAAHAIGYSADLQVRLHQHRLGPRVHHVDGTPRVVLPDRDHRYYLDLTCAQVRRYGRAEPTVLVALLRMLRDVAVVVRDAEQAEEVRRQVRLVVAEMSDRLQPEDAETVHDLAARVEQALRGEVGPAFADRAGETRSL